MDPEQGSPTDPFERLEPTNALERLAVSYLRWGVRHRNALTFLCLGMTALLFLVVWQLFGLIAGVVALLLLLALGAGTFLTLRNASGREG